jgi:rod shape-determining protein MreC
LRYLPDDAQVKAGDLVITSRLSATFPEGLLIGKVVRVNSGPNFPTTESIVQPAVNLAQVEEVIVILAP